MKKYNIAVVGATGMVGRKFLQVLEERKLPVENYYLFAYSLLLLAFLIKVLIDEEGQVNTALLVCIALTLAFTSQLSAYGIYIAILSLNISAAPTISEILLYVSKSL